MREGHDEGAAGAWWWVAGSLAGTGVVAFCATPGLAWRAVHDKAEALGLLPPEGPAEGPAAGSTSRAAARDGAVAGSRLP